MKDSFLSTIPPPLQCNDMVFIDVISEIGARVWSNLCYLIC